MPSDSGADRAMTSTIRSWRLHGNSTVPMVSAECDGVTIKTCVIEWYAVFSGDKLAHMDGQTLYLYYPDYFLGPVLDLLTSAGPNRVYFKPESSSGGLDRPWRPLVKDVASLKYPWEGCMPHADNYGLPDLNLSFKATHTIVIVPSPKAALTPSDPVAPHIGFATEAGAHTIGLYFVPSHFILAPSIGKPDNNPASIQMRLPFGAFPIGMQFLASPAPVDYYLTVNQDLISTRVVAKYGELGLSGERKGEKRVFPYFTPPIA